MSNFVLTSSRQSRWNRLVQLCTYPLEFSDVVIGVIPIPVCVHSHHSSHSDSQSGVFRPVGRGGGVRWVRTHPQISKM